MKHLKIFKTNTMFYAINWSLKKIKNVAGKAVACDFTGKIGNWTTMAKLIIEEQLEKGSTIAK